MKSIASPEKSPFHVLVVKYIKSMMLLVAPTLILCLALSAHQIIRQYQTQLREEALAAQRASDVMDVLWTNTRAAAMQTAYANETLTFARMDRSAMTSAFRLAYANIQSQLKLTEANVTAAEYIMLYFTEPEYFATVNSSWSTYYEEYDTRRNHPVSLVRSLYGENAEAGWVRAEGVQYFYQPVISRGKPIGALILRFGTGLVDQALKNSLPGDGYRMLLTDESGSILFDSDGSAHSGTLAALYLGAATKSGDTFLMNGVLYLKLIVPSGEAGWQYVILSRLDDFQRALSFSFTVVAALAVAMILLSLIVAHRVARSMCKPFETIYTLLNEPTSQASSRYSSQYARYDDLGMIYALIFKTKYLNYCMQNELTAQQNLLKDAQRKALQAQINPHFIFNTLESINWKVMARMPSEREIPDMIRSLAAILRMNLRINAPLNTVREELEHARLYIRVQQMRFEGLFEVEWSIEDAALDLATIRFSLQPILENAISHGVKLLDKDGLIRVACSLEEGHVVFSVSDNGPGFEKQTLDELNQAFVDSRVIRDEHIGLVNLNARLQLIFGMAYRLQLESSKEGARVIMRIPQMLPADAENFLRADAGL